jgi:UDP-N-acetylmuramoyl-tripeptide--D-alanyl-D-alanine ligase
MNVKEIVKATGGKLLSGSPEADIDLSKISTDSRTIKKGEFFLALSGPNFSGSDFVKDALKKGAAGAIAEHIAVSDASHGKVLIRVKNGTKALQDIAACHRMKFNIPVICITGSNGKTTVKDMTAAVLSTYYNVLKNEGTKNNHIGVPQTLLKLQPDHDICVLELGTNHRGEIKALAAIARPTVAVLTNIGASHLEFLKDLRGVYEEKKDILKFLDKKNGVIILNGDDDFLSKIKGARSKVVRYGLKKSNNFNARIVSTDKDKIAFLLNGKEGIELNLLGVHNVYNALAAIAVAARFKIGYDHIKNALAAFRPTGMRLALINAGNIDILNDSYNSNPLSMKTAVEAMKSRPARARWIVSGDMLELGKESARFHRMVGEMIASAGIEGLLTFGEFSRHTLSAALGAGMDEEHLWHCATHDEIVGILKEVVQDGDLVLVKGSRSMRMEKVVEKLTEGKR